MKLVLSTNPNFDYGRDQILESIEVPDLRTVPERGRGKYAILDVMQGRRSKQGRKQRQRKWRREEAKGD